MLSVIKMRPAGARGRPGASRLGRLQRGLSSGARTVSLGPGVLGRTPSEPTGEAREGLGGCPEVKGNSKLARAATRLQGRWVAHTPGAPEVGGRGW